jgi:hypothetical protein
MNKTILALVLVFITMTSISAVSAGTLIAGKTYNADFSDVVSGADVEVTCGNETMTDTSESDGTYAVNFDEEDCTIGDEVTVEATKGDLYGEETGIVLDGATFNVPCNDLAVVNVPMIPEFGLVIGALTAISAIGIFFFVRRK